MASGSPRDSSVVHETESDVSPNRTLNTVAARWVIAPTAARCVTAQKVYGCVEALMLAVTLAGPNDVMREIEDMEGCEIFEARAGRHVQPDDVLATVAAGDLRVSDQLAGKSA